MKARRTGLLLGATVVMFVGSPGVARADLYLSGYPDAPESTCGESYEGTATDKTCTITAIGRTFAVGGSGSTAFVVTLEAPSEIPGGPAEVVARCEGVGSGGCVGGSTYWPDNPFPGATLTCRVQGLGAGKFECSSFDID